MKATAMSRVLLVVGLLVLSVQAQGQLAPASGYRPGDADPWAKKVNLEVSNMKLSDALATLFKGSGINYSVNPDVGSITVTLVLKDVTLSDAFKEITRAAGAEWMEDNDAHIVRVGSRDWATSEFMVKSGLAAPSGPAKPVTGAAPESSEVITPRYLSAPELAAVLSGPGLRAMTTNNDKLILYGSEDRIGQANALIKALDVPPPELQPYRVSLVARITLREGGKQANSFELTSESVGLEGEIIPVEINSGKTDTVEHPVYADVVTPKTVERNISVWLRVMPPVASDPKGLLRLSGEGHLKVSEKTSTYDKSFDFALCDRPGEAVSIARGSSDFGDASGEFEVSVTVTPEKGKVPRPTRAQPPAYGPSYGGNFGGGGYGSYGGGNYGGANNYGAARSGYGGGYSQPVSPGPAPQPPAAGGKPPANPPGESRSW